VQAELQNVDDSTTHSVDATAHSISALPSGNCSGAKHIVFLKFHQVGSGLVFAFLENFMQLPGYPALEAIRRGGKQSNPINHRDSFAEVRKWIKAGKIPDDTCALTIMRNPSERFLSTFFKHQFAPGVFVGSAKVNSVHPDEKLRELTGAPDWSGTLRSKHLEKFFLSKAHEHEPHDPTKLEQLKAHEHEPHDPTKLEHLLMDKHRYSEYSIKLGTLEAAKPLLNQFSLVGINEKEEAFLSSVCHLFGVSTYDCSQCLTAAKNDKKNAHSFPRHSSSSDFSPGFQVTLRNLLKDDWDLYTYIKKRLRRQRDM